MAIDLELARNDRKRRKPEQPRDYNFTPEHAAEELDYLIDKYQITEPHDMAVIIATVQHLVPGFYDDL